MAVFRGGMALKKAVGMNGNDRLVNLEFVEIEIFSHNQDSAFGQLLRRRKSNPHFVFFRQNQDVV